MEFRSFLDRCARCFRRKEANTTVASRHGRIGEKEAARFLKDKGLGVLEKNWKSGRDEIDIICLDGNTLVFVEVKTRQGDSPIEAFHAVTRKKKNALGRAAKAFLKKESSFSCYRFDIITVNLSGTDVTAIRHYEDCGLMRW